MEADEAGLLLAEAISNMGSGTPTWALFISAAAIIIAAILGAIWQRRISRQTLTYNTLINQLWDKDYISTRKQFIGIRENDGGQKLEQLARSESETDSQSEAVRLILNNYEMLALGISTGVLDEEIVRRYSKTNTCRDFERMRPYIDEVRKTFPKVYVEYEALYEKWRNSN